MSEPGGHSVGRVGIIGRRHTDDADKSPENKVHDEKD